MAGQQAAREFLARRHRHLVDGEWVDSAAGKSFAVTDPATGGTIAHVAEGEAEDIARAAAAARRAFDDERWTRIAPPDRSRIMNRIADLLDAHADELALIETLDNGKPLKASRGDVLRAAEKFRYCAGWITKLTGEAFDSTLPAGWHGFTVREPVGVAGLIVPWNFPLSMAVNKIAPALAAGCAMVLKPAEQTPLSALRLGEIVMEAGVPAGIVNVVTGFGAVAGAALVEHPGVDKVSFTGSTDVGKQIVRAATGNLKRVSLELGGKSPVIIFPDADLDRTIKGAADFIFGNTGQNCGAGSRLYADRRIFDRVVEGIAAQAQKLKVGSGLEPDTDLGPIISQRQLDRVTGYMQAGAAAGAHVVTGGGRIEREGFFVEPTIFTETRPDMSVWREEIFGPVLCAASFGEDELDRIIADANDTNYGLGAYVWTRDLGIAHRMARKLKAGFVRVNGGAHFNVLPFGGYKQSGWGRESGREGIELFTEVKSVIMGF
ncbi:MAG: aldehyde dehydrogenase family protein [Rhizobiaceae bacterium]